jgi:hypothetical protein
LENKPSSSGRARAQATSLSTTPGRNALPDALDRLRHLCGYFSKENEFAYDASPATMARIAQHVSRHSLVARLFHWIMAASMFMLLFNDFLPKGVSGFPE